MDNCIGVVPVRAGHRHEMCGSLNLERKYNHSVHCTIVKSVKGQQKFIPYLSHWLHKRVPHHNRDVCTTEIAKMIRSIGKGTEFVGMTRGCLSELCSSSHLYPSVL